MAGIVHGLEVLQSEVSYIRTFVILQAAVGVVQVDDAADKDSNGCHERPFGEETQQQTRTGSSEGSAHTTFFGPALGLQPDGADDGEAEVYQEEKCQHQAAIYLLRIAFPQF